MMAGSKKVFATLGSSNHVPEEREAFDYYATDPKAVEMLLELEQFAPVIGNRPVVKATFPRCFRHTVIKSFPPILFTGALVILNRWTS